VAEKEYTEGQLVATWIGIGIALFGGVGVVLATASGNPGLIGIGPGLGVAFGAAVGAAQENRARAEGNLRPLAAPERRRLRRALWLGIALVLLGVAASAAVVLL
jgi:hypothetical protein